MRSLLMQTLAVTIMDLKSVLQRFWISLSTVTAIRSSSWCC